MLTHIHLYIISKHLLIHRNSQNDPIEFPIILCRLPSIWSRSCTLSSRLWRAAIHNRCTSLRCHSARRRRRWRKSSLDDQKYGSFMGVIQDLYGIFISIYIYKYGNLLQSYGQWQSLDDKHDDVPNEAWWFSMAMLNYEGIGVYRIHICIQCVCIYIHIFMRLFRFIWYF